MTWSRKLMGIQIRSIDTAAGEQEVIRCISKSDSRSVSLDQRHQHHLELVRNANYAPPHSYRIRNSGGRA